MGLLDDAIRDHLELKRLRGADPGEVAREQREALEPDLGDEPSAANEESATALDDSLPDLNRETMSVRATPATPPSPEGRDATPAPPRSAGSSSVAEETTNVAEETAELDMRTVMDEHPGGSVQSGSSESPGAAGQTIGGQSLDDRDDEQLEWEIPGESSGETRADAGHHDRTVGDDGR